MRYYDAIEALESKGISLVKSIQILNAVFHFRYSRFAQCVTLAQHANMEPAEAATFLKRHVL